MQGYPLGGIASRYREAPTARSLLGVRAVALGIKNGYTPCTGDVNPCRRAALHWGYPWGFPQYYDAKGDVGRALLPIASRALPWTLP